jgi:hypothetical protein
MGVELHTIHSEIYSEAAQFLAQFPNEKRSVGFWRARFDLWWDENAAFSEEYDRGWILRNRDHIVGFMGNIPLEIQFNHSPKKVFSSTTWRVLPEYRKHSMKLMFKFMGNAEDTVLFNTTPNREVRAVLRAFKFELIPAYSRSVTVITINSPRAYQEKLQRLPRFLRPCLAPFQAFTKVLDIDLPRPELQVRSIEHAGEDFDQLWVKTKSVYANTNIRNSRWINWYCNQDNAFQKKLYGCYREEELAGFCITWNPKGNEIRCLDIWSHPEDRLAISALVTKMIQEAQECRATRLFIPHFSRSLEQHLIEKDFGEIRPRERNDFFKMAKSLDWTSDRDSSYFTTAQGDVGL